MSKPKNVERYSPHFVDFPFLTFIPSRYEYFHDGDQPYATVQPEQFGFARGDFASLATYPVDGDFVIFGFKTFELAQKFAYPVGSPVETIDVAAARNIKRLEEVAYALWYWRANFRKLTHEQFLAENPRFAATFGLASDHDLRVAEQACRKSGSGTPMSYDILEAMKETR